MRLVNGIRAENWLFRLTYNFDSGTVSQRNCTTFSHILHEMRSKQSWTDGDADHGVMHTMFIPVAVAGG